MWQLKRTGGNIYSIKEDTAGCRWQFWGYLSTQQYQQCTYWVRVGKVSSEAKRDFLEHFTTSISAKCSRAQFELGVTRLCASCTAGDACAGERAGGESADTTNVSNFPGGLFLSLYPDLSRRGHYGASYKSNLCIEKENTDGIFCRGWHFTWDVARSEVTIREADGQTWSQSVGALP